MISIRQLIFIYFLIFIGLFGHSKTSSSSSSSNEDDDDVYVLHNSTDLNAINEYNKDEFIFINTIDGIFYAIDKHNGDIKWSLNEDAVIRFPKNNDKPYFLTDPRDGSLYVSSSRDGLKKFPYTIPELVSASPSKSSDGYLYTGDKRDQWIAIDVLTGQKLDTLTSETLSTKTTTSNNNLIYIGRTQYTISMFDINTRKRKFNVTYYDYSTHTADTIDESTFAEDPIKAQFSSSSSSKKKQTDILNYPYYHFTSSSDGLIITVDKRTGEIVWQRRLNNPVVAMYQHLNDHLYKLNFAIFSIETLTNLAQESWRYKALFTDSSAAKDLIIKTIFTPTLYVGYYNENFYALPAFVFSAQIGPNFPRLPGPQPSNAASIPNNAKPSSSSSSGSSQKPGDTELSTIPSNSKLIDIDDDDDANKTFLGHHSLPASYSPNYIKTDLGVMVERSSDFLANYFDKDKKQSPANCPITPKKESKKSWFEPYTITIQTTVIAAIVSLSLICWDRRNRRRIEDIDRSSGGSMSSQEHSNHSNSNSRHSTTSGSNNNNNIEHHIPQIVHNSMSVPDMKDGFIKIGKILYDPKAVLGHGSEGTFVYKGSFENRPIAVKRILPECYTLADREVELLRDADQHPNVLRYFCTEADAQFRYIALELCQTTLQDYVNRREEFTKQIKPLTVLEQATHGLSHLHSLGIVHRDIKPHNVLLSFPNNKGEIVAMISDFGLCKRLDTGCTSYSKRSGITGTEGWIAPELLDNTSPHYKDSFTKSVDIFSLGCLYYYVLTFGIHPFGDHLRRQANILGNHYTLDKLLNYNCDSYMQKTLIEKMISVDPKQRPTAKSLVIHPIFWSKAKILQFLQDVSDRIEKINPDDPILIDLEKGANAIIRNNWKVHICTQLQDDLKKFRSYNGVSVRDLLRAIRNKKHHYRELSDPVKQSLGSLPDEFVDYFTTRFPKLILHTYEAMRSCKGEAMLDVYYNEN